MALIENSSINTIYYTTIKIKSPKINIKGRSLSNLIKIS